jgi:TorA maturation chaperone TorD
MEDKVGDVYEVDAARAQDYALLSAVLAGAPGQPLLERLADLRCEGATVLERAHDAVARAASDTGAAQVECEYCNLFCGELLPYGSYYLTGFLHERPLARLRADLSRLGRDRGPELGEGAP